MAQWETLKDAYSITKIDENIDSLSGADWSASLDLIWHTIRHPCLSPTKYKTAFSTPQGGSIN